MVTIMLPLNAIIELRGYIDAAGKQRFTEWFEGLPATAAAKVVTALSRMEHGNFRNAKGVSGGVYEYRIDFGPGYRIYFGRDGDHIVILLGGGSKKHQSKDIQDAQACWQDYKQRKKRESQ